jgi:2,3,4,5-tetrahydropyridine-2-carboxylate N-succinyltransferase
MSSLAHGHGIATFAGSTLLDVWFPAPALGALTGAPDQTLAAMVHTYVFTFSLIV